jgi:hypothetical protein
VAKANKTAFVGGRPARYYHKTIPQRSFMVCVGERQPDAMERKQKL